MSARQNIADHHASAAFHHGAAAEYHREASRHYRIGKDYAHAAHKALVAHVHGLQATERGNQAGRSYASNLGHRPVESAAELSVVVPAPDVAASLIEAGLEEAEHHNAAANCHEQAMAHHARASKYLEAGDYSRAAEATQMARGDAEQATFHGEESANHHAEHYGKAGLTAEII